MNQILFGIIGVILLVIAGVAGTLLRGAGSYVLITPVATTTTQTATTTAQAPGTYTLAQVATHNSATSCYSAIDGGVYDLTDWIREHPGGSAAILSLCGIDGSAAFNAQHGGQPRPEQELVTLKIGVLVR